ncbi:MAG TPA: TolC family protein, partial [Chroococcales cyanobacterium]
NMKGQVSKARNAAEMSRLSLFNTINVPPRAARLEATPELPEVRFEQEKIELALNNRPEMKQLSLKRDVDLRTIDLSTRAYLPTVAAIGSYSMQGAGTGRYWLAGVSAQWNLLDGGKTKSKIAQSQSDVARDEALLDLTRSRLALDVQKSIQDRDEARERLNIADEGLSFAQESFRLSEVRYRSGVGTGLEVIDSQSALTQAEQNRIGAFYDLQAAELKLARSLGIDLRDYLRGTK